MKRLALGFAGALLLASAALAGDPSIWSNADYWGAFDWSRIEETDIWKDGQVPDGDTKTGYGTIVREDTGIDLAGGAPFALNVQESKDQPGVRSIHLFAIGPGADICDQTERHLNKTFGVAKVSYRQEIESFGGMSPKMPASDAIAQWVAGRTTVTQHCMTIQGVNGRRTSIITVAFEPSDAARTFTPPVAVSCAFAAKPIAALARFSIDDFRSYVLLASGKIIPGEITAAQAVFPGKDAGAKGKTIRVDRATGRLQVLDSRDREVGDPECRFGAP